MKKALKILGFGLGGLVVLFLLFLAFINFSSLPTYEKVEIPDLNVEATPARLEMGQHIASTLCIHCHLGEDGKLSGKEFPVGALGELYAGNITQDQTAGIASYTDGELYRLFRTGIKRDHHLAMPAMTRVPHMSDEDVYSIIAYLKAGEGMVKPVSVSHPAPKLSLLGKMLWNFAFKPLEYPVGKIETPTLDDPIAYGEYLVDVRHECFACHSASFETNDIVNPKSSPGYLQGGNPIPLPNGDTLISPDIIPDPVSEFGRWTEMEFVQAIQTGQRPDGTVFQMPMLAYTKLDTAEILAIWEYLKTVPVPNKSDL